MVGVAKESLPNASEGRKINDPPDRIEAEDRERDPGPVLRLGEEPAARLALTCEVLSLLQSYYDFSSGVAFFQIPDCLRDFTQLVTPVDHRFHFSGLH